MKMVIDSVYLHLKTSGGFVIVNIIVSIYIYIFVLYYVGNALKWNSSKKFCKWMLIHNTNDIYIASMIKVKV